MKAAGNENTQATTISSSITFVTKVIFPALWFAGFGFGTLCTWLEPTRFPESMALQFTAAWIVGTAFVCWSGVGLKRVRLDDKVLYISNYVREIAVPLSNVKNVTEVLWINIRPITIHFHNTTEFGNKVTFTPPQKLAFWNSHPIVAELKLLARKAREAER